MLIIPKSTSLISYVNGKREYLFLLISQSIININIIRCCKDTRLGPWKDVIQKAVRAMTMDFLDHICVRWKM